jgi:hypothetical protein
VLIEGIELARYAALAGRPPDEGRIDLLARADRSQRRLTRRDVRRAACAQCRHHRACSLERFPPQWNRFGDEIAPDS